MKKVKTNYSYKPTDESKSVRTAMRAVEMSYKNTHQTVTILRGKYITAAIKYLNDVLAKKRCVPMKKYNGGVRRTAQAKEFGVLQGRWPEKSATNVLPMLKNMISTATAKGLDVAKMKITHAQVNRAPIIHNRTYRAHGRVTAWNKSPCHIEMVAEETVGEIPTEQPSTTLAQKRAERRRIVLNWRGRLKFKKSIPQTHQKW